MSDNVGYTPGTGATVAADNIGGVLHQRVKIGIGADGSATDVSAANPMPITAPAAIPISGALTDAELRASPVRISAEDAEWLLRQIVSLLISPAGFDRSQARTRVTAILESGAVSTVATVSTVSTVTAVSALNNFGTLPAEAVARHQNLGAWQLCQRSTIS